MFSIYFTWIKFQRKRIAGQRKAKEKVQSQSESDLTNCEKLNLHSTWPIIISTGKALI